MRALSFWWRGNLSSHDGRDRVYQQSTFNGHVQVDFNMAYLRTPSTAWPTTTTSHSPWIHTAHALHSLLQHCHPPPTRFNDRHKWLRKTDERQAGRKRSVSSLSPTFATDWTTGVFPLCQTQVRYSLSVPWLFTFSSGFTTIALTALLLEDLFLSGPSSSKQLIDCRSCTLSWSKEK